MQPLENVFNFVLVCHRKKYDNDCDSQEKRKPVILMMADIVAPQREKDSPHKPPRCADDEEFPYGQMSQSEDIAKVILREAGDQEE